MLTGAHEGKVWSFVNNRLFRPATVPRSPLVSSAHSLLLTSVHSLPSFGLPPSRPASYTLVPLRPQCIRGPGPALTQPRGAPKPKKCDPKPSPPGPPRGVWREAGTAGPAYLLSFIPLSIKQQNLSKPNGFIGIIGMRGQFCQSPAPPGRGGEERTRGGEARWKSGATSIPGGAPRGPCLGRSGIKTVAMTTFSKGTAQRRDHTCKLRRVAWPCPWPHGRQIPFSPSGHTPGSVVGRNKRLFPKERKRSPHLTFKGRATFQCCLQRKRCRRRS